MKPLSLGDLKMRSYPRHGTLERLPATAADEGLPELDVGFYDWVLTADHLSGEPGTSKGFWLDRAV